MIAKPTRLISHRGNLNGRIPEKENTIPHIKEAFNAGFDVEVDVWYVDDEWWLGHDKPEHIVGENGLDFSILSMCWCHCKNSEALNTLNYFKQNSSVNVHYFSHDKDDYTITSQGWVWAYPGKPIIYGSVVLMLENFPKIEYTPSQYAIMGGICADDIQKYTYLNKKQ